MKTIKHRFATVFGICVIIASLCSGCATQPNPNRIAMATQDLNYFVVDCGRKQQQVEFIQSLRVTPEQQLSARLRMMAKPWEIITDQPVYAVNFDTAINNPNKYVNFILRELQAC